MSSGSNVERHPIPPARKSAPEASGADMRQPERGRFSFRGVVLITVAFVLVTLLVMYSILHGLGDEEDTQATGEVAVTSSDGGGSSNGSEIGDYEDLKFGSLPPGGKYTKKGSGKFRTAGEPGKTFGKGKKKFTYVVEVETTLKSSAYGGADAFAAMVPPWPARSRGWAIRSIPSSTWTKRSCRRGRSRICGFS